MSPMNTELVPSLVTTKLFGPITNWSGERRRMYTRCTRGPVRAATWERSSRSRRSPEPIGQPPLSPMTGAAQHLPGRAAVDRLHDPVGFVQAAQEVGGVVRIDLQRVEADAERRLGERRPRSLPAWSRRPRSPFRAARRGACR